MIYFQCVVCGKEFGTYRAWLKKTKNPPLTCGDSCYRRHYSNPAVFFWPKVNKLSDIECWLWLACVDYGGYGQIYDPILKKPIGAHQMAWKIRYGSLPNDKILRHTCDTPPCVNWNHLIPGTHMDNKHDSMDRGRHNKGEKVPASKLTADMVREIRDFHESGLSNRLIASIYGIGPTTVFKIVHKEYWKHV